MRRFPLAMLAALAACGSPEQPPASEEAQVEAPAVAPELTPVPQPAQDLAVLDSRDCRTVAQAYIDAIARRDFAFAARVWSDPVIDDARLAALFEGYERPAIAIADLAIEGAAGSSYCTVTGALTDAADPAGPPRQGVLTLRRANGVPGATPEQLRWTIQSSTFVEKMERSGRGEPA
ncbi:hypothetical protein GRI75_11475 [Altererythrobacter soli]|uniref:SnoaL-like domain-containing protein n=1 Tax=Croceibacterium soli TaxID=1739690 RepID=A0A6I4UWY5_9SPHN|nr:hypothetical protein [Croceibacterium soli]MXP42259.1 hypothetical protein [Croceibacterium soli]